MGWFLNRALTGFRAAVNARWPSRDRTSDGTIGDAAHAKRTSDHNPDADGSVDAWDMDVDGVDVELCKRAFQQHPSSGYWIHNDQIASRSDGWRRRPYAYAGPTRNRHTRHVHWNTRPAQEDSTAPWNLVAPWTKFPTPTGPHPPGSRTLRLTQPRMTGRDVTFVQEWIGAARCGPPDGVYGPATEHGVRWYQGMRGIAVDGICGPDTWAQMGL